jgi:hypothetical protein
METHAAERRRGRPPARLPPLLAWALVAVWSAWARLGLACPSCRLGREVRARIYHDPLGMNLAAAALPLLVVCVIAAALHRIGRPPSN